VCIAADEDGYLISYSTASSAVKSEYSSQMFQFDNVREQTI
jgi:hypothetical protein